MKLLEVDGHKSHPSVKIEETLLRLLAAWIDSCGVAKPERIHEGGQEQVGGEAGWGIWTWIKGAEYFGCGDVQRLAVVLWSSPRRPPANLFVLGGKKARTLEWSNSSKTKNLGMGLKDVLFIVGCHL